MLEHLVTGFLKWRRSRSFVPSVSVLLSLHQFGLKCGVIVTLNLTILCPFLHSNTPEIVRFPSRYSKSRNCALLHEVQKKLGQILRILFRKEPRYTRHFHQSPIGKGIRQLLADLRIHETILLSPQNQRGYVNVAELDVLHVLLADRAGE